MNKTTTTTVQTLANDLYSAFQHDTRNDGSKFVKLVDGAPSWMTEVIHTAHGDKFPDDTVYEFVYRAAMALAESSEGDEEDSISEIEPDIYTHDLTAWLHERVDHVGYIDEAISEFGQFENGFSLLAAAQKMQIDEVGYSVLSSLRDLVDEMPEEESEFDHDDGLANINRMDAYRESVRLLHRDNDYWYWLDTNTYSRD